MIEVTIRDYRSQSDDAYIYSTWSKYAFYSPTEPINMSKEAFFRHKCEEIRNILDDGVIKVACLKGHDYVILGYVVVYEGKVKWLCVKKNFPRSEITELLLKSIKGEVYE